MDSLRQKAARGVSWSAIDSVVTSVLQMGQLAILTRLLPPDDFGLRALVSVVVGFAMIYADMGIGNAIVHKQNITDSQLSTLYWVNIAFGVISFAIVMAISPLIVWFYHEPKLYSLLPWAGSIFMLDGMVGVQSMLFQKELRFKLISIIDMASQAAGVVASIVLALRGAGVMALILGQVVTYAARTAVILVVAAPRWRPRFYMNMKEIKGFISFGLFQTGEHTVNYFARNIDKILLGKLLGTDMLGYYSVASNIVLLPISRINPILNRVTFPVFSKVQNDTAKLRTGYMFVIKFLGFVNIPLLLGLIAVANQFALVFLGPHWEKAIFIIQILAIVAILRSISNPSGGLLVAKGQVARSFAFTSVRLLIQVPVIYLLGAHFGIVGLLSAVLLLQAIEVVANFQILLKRNLGITFIEYFRPIIVWVFYGGVMGSVVWLVKHLIPVASLPHLVVLILTGVFSYSLLVLLFQRGFLRELKNLRSTTAENSGTTDLSQA